MKNETAGIRWLKYKPRVSADIETCSIASLKKYTKKYRSAVSVVITRETVTPVFVCDNDPCTSIKQ